MKMLTTMVDDRCITIRTLSYRNQGKFLIRLMQDLYHQPY